MKLFKRPTPSDMQSKLIREAEENLVTAEAMLEYYQYSVMLYRARLERLRYGVSAKNVVSKQGASNEN